MMSVSGWASRCRDGIVLVRIVLSLSGWYCPCRGWHCRFCHGNAGGLDGPVASCHGTAPVQDDQGRAHPCLAQTALGLKERGRRGWMKGGGAQMGTGTVTMTAEGGGGLFYVLSWLCWHSTTLCASWGALLSGTQEGGGWYFLETPGRAMMNRGGVGAGTGAGSITHRHDHDRHVTYF